MARGDLPPPRAPSRGGAAEEVPGADRGAAAVGPAEVCKAGKRRGSFPPSGLEREEEAGEVPPTRAPGRAAGEREGGGERPAGNHLRLPRPPRPAPRPPATRRPSAPCWGGPAIPEPPTPPAEPRGARAQSPPAPQARVGRCREPRRRRRRDSPDPAAHLRWLPRWRLSLSRSCFPGNAGQPVWVPWSLPLQSCQDFWDALVDPKEDLNKSFSGQEFCSQLGI